MEDIAANIVEISNKNSKKSQYKGGLVLEPKKGNFLFLNMYVEI